ncbi:S-adenosyl-L-methionine-dependent methyltransferase [Mycena olivaceomarginata]|nr:S-adenosyl-L-methionine-dependent methyltransferase [Mycena olivaceomarginata]
MLVRRSTLFLPFLVRSSRSRTHSVLNCRHHIFMESLQELDVLQAALNEAIDAIREELSTHNLPPLSTSGHTPHPLDDPHYTPSPRIFEARKLALGEPISGQLRNLLQVPFEKVMEQYFGTYDTACMDVALRTGILDMISERKACSVTELSDSLALDPRKVTTVMRYLAAQGWFLEPSHDTFSLSRGGLELRRGQNGRSWAQTPRMKVASCLLDMLTRPESKMSSSPLNTAFQLAFETPLPVFEYLQQHPLDMEQWSGSVRAYSNFHQRALMADYPWEKFTPGTFVDCGGGQGYLSVLLAKRFKDSSFVVQDLPEMVPIARRNILQYPEAAFALEEGRMIVEAHDFFQPQPRVADVYIFKHILHDWPDSVCVKILKNAIKGNPNATILIIDYVALPSSFSRPAESPSTITPLESQYDSPITPPAFMPQNFGAASLAPLGLGVHMLALYNACERTFVEWEKIITTAGLSVATVKSLRANASVIECRTKNTAA